MRKWQKYKEKPVEWYFVITLGLALEYLALKQGRGRTLSNVIWRMRSDKIGRYLLVSCWLWLTYHFFFEGD